MTKDYLIGLPIHQWPKKKDSRQLILPPPGYCFIVADVESQETKLMTCFSQDRAFLEIYTEGLNPHAYTASRISGVDYGDIVQGKAENERLAVIYKAGKITNLGENYRMGAATLWKNAHTQWGLTPTKEDVKNWVRVWRSTYGGVIAHWKRLINRARMLGYAETVAGRRFYIDQWSKNRWSSESSAIMHPVQGSGADMKYLAIAAMRSKFPELTFWGEVHDEIIYTVAVGGDIRNLCKRVKKVLDSLPYKAAWGWCPDIPFTWSVGYGKTWGDIEDV